MIDNQQADLIADAVIAVGRSKAPYVEFAPGPFADAVGLAAQAGYLDTVGNGLVQLTGKGRDLLFQKDPGGRVLVELRLKCLEATGEFEGHRQDLEAYHPVSDANLPAQSAD
ncbi:hypothetical protein [Burkholderia cepacia]|uniref:hypothetical protein n=1 Tax=Burkholderia cepacia TaxID=292 RepID=UPI0026DEC36A|nr:hypothetical protein [Burkholderia cepacia]MDO5947991.1 hypothetical protein [Burkholderia cepacia]